MSRRRVILQQRAAGLLPPDCSAQGREQWEQSGHAPIKPTQHYQAETKLAPVPPGRRRQRLEADDRAVKTILNKPATALDLLQNYIGADFIEAEVSADGEELQMRASWRGLEHSVTVQTTGRKEHELDPLPGHKRKIVAWALHDDYVAAAEELKAWKAAHDDALAEPAVASARATGKSVAIKAKRKVAA